MAKMTSESLDRLREMQRKIEADAARVTTRDDLIRLRMYWGDIQTVLDNEQTGE
jgi:hypothetical protein